ncbi:Nn.00g004710.m01.CDS01 [Neocucurbitaria sp. VM-36]
MASEQPNYQPTCEDYHSDESDGRVLESFTGRKSPAAANVSTKRSHPSDLDKEKPPAQERVSANIDLRSDSGYSSYTAATVSSADSAPSATSRRSPPVAPANTAPLPSHSPAPKPRRPTLSEQRQSSNSSPRPKPVSRTASQSSRRPGAHRRPTITQDRRESRDEECADPNCTKCGPNALPQRRRPDLPPSQSARDVSILSDQRSMRSDPAAYYTSPPSPTYARQSTYMQGPAIVQPAPPRRRSSSTTRQQRPMSYSGEPGVPYWVPGMPAPYPSPPQEQHGPPPSASAYRNMQQYPQMPQVPQGAPYMVPHAQPNGYYAPQYPLNQTSPPYDLQPRPDLSTRNSSYYGTRNQPAPIVTQERREPPKYSARYPQPQSATQTKFPTLQLQDEAYESSESGSSSEEEYEPNPRHALMAPPKIKRSKSSSKKQRPNLRHANTTQVVDRLERRSSIVVPERPKDRDRASRSNNASTRGVSVTRPAAPERQTQSAYDTRTARVVVNNTRANRRQSTQIYDKMYEQYAQAKAIEERLAKAKALEEEAAQARLIEQGKARALEEQYKAEQKRQKRSSRAYYPPVEFDDDVDEEEEERPAPLRNGRRRPTDADNRKGKERIVDTKNRRTELAAEDYISAQRGSQNPYADQIHKAAKGASRMPSGPSDSGSSRSRGSDKQSQSARTVATTNGGNEIRLRVDASAPLSLSFNGDMEGRTLQFTPAENGMADIVIGNSRGGESTYRTSERGSVVGSSRKSLVTSQARRDAEEMTERSSRSGRSRREGSQNDRDGQRHVLRRRTDYRN